MKKFTLWTEGYMATGEQGRAFLLGAYPVETIDEAVELYLQENPDMRKYLAIHNEPNARSKYSLWACRLFNNEEDAKKSYG